MKTLRIILLLLEVAGLSWSIPQADSDHRPGFPEYNYDYETGGDYEDEGNVDYGEPPKFADPSQTFTAKEGDAVTMPCMPEKAEHLSEKSHYTLIIKKIAGAKEKSETLFLGTSKVVKDRRIKLNGGQLEISKLGRLDAGEYVCYFDHSTVVEVRHTLFVQYPPKTIRINANMNETVRMNQDSHVLKCESIGYPVPSITWSREDGGVIPPSAVIKEAEDKDYKKKSSLTVEVKDRHAEGTYTCSAENGIGQPSSDKITLLVSYPPEIVLERGIVHSALDEHVHLTCLVYGRPKPKVTWTHNSHEKKSVKSPHEGGFKYTLNINSLKEKDLGDYACTALNNLGQARKDITITDKPSAPEFTSDPNGGEDTSYVLTFNAWGFNITHYTIKCREMNEDPVPEKWKDMANYTATKANLTIIDDLTSFTITLTDLQPATDYLCNVRIGDHNKVFGPEKDYLFSTKKDQVIASQSTSDGIRISSFGFSAAISLIIILCV